MASLLPEDPPHADFIPGIPLMLCRFALRPSKGGRGNPGKI
jgi:hypothetical protein